MIADVDIATWLNGCYKAARLNIENAFEKALENETDTFKIIIKKIIGLLVILQIEEPL